VLFLVVICLIFLLFDPGSGGSSFPPEYVILFRWTTGDTSQKTVLFKPVLKHHTGLQLQKWAALPLYMGNSVPVRRV
jgi:hypothetical protein